MAATVLVIDDDIQARSQLVQLLTAQGYTPLCAISQAEVMDILAHETIDILIYELGLCAVNGLNLLERIKQSCPLLPVLVMSSVGNMDDVIRALRLGAADYLVQPLNTPEVLLHSLKQALEHARLEQENQNYRAHLERTNQELNQRLDELRNDQQAGRELQQRMLPKPLDLDGVCCSHQIYPALFLSGDFLDYFKISEHQIAFYLADISGHGSSSAFVTVLLKKLIDQLKRSYLRGLGTELINPERVLAYINADLEASRLDKYLTVFYAVLNTQTLQLSYSVGGHLPMPLLLSQGQAQYLEGRGMPVGLFAEANYSTYHCQLPDDFQLLLFSDGVLEMLEAQPLADKEAQLLTLVHACQGNLDCLAARLGLSNEAEVPDDIAMVAIARSCS